MGKDRFFIGPYASESGQNTSLKPFMIPDTAFEELTNAYVFRGRVRKRFGSSWVNQAQSQTGSRLRMSSGTLASPSNLPSGAVGAIGQMFSIANVLFTVNALGTPANLLVSNGSATTATFNTSTGAFVFSGVKDINGNAIATSTSIYWYPSLPVMGLISQETASVDEATIAFDTNYSYQYLSTGWDRITGEGNSGASIWSGSNSEFFWSANWLGAAPNDMALFVTNFNPNEANFMRYLTGGLWYNFNPTIDNSSNTLISAQILVIFKNRMLALNTWEGPSSPLPGVQYQFRCRYSAIGSPLPNNGDSWRADIPGNGNFIDAPTTEAIVSAEYVKDRLIVFFERSTWEIIYTGNQLFPFQWQKINTELGVESAFSIVPFDKVAIGVGNVGVHACNGANVERIDTNIPNAVFNIHGPDSGTGRVYGVRDYQIEMIYWTFPGQDFNDSFPFPNQVLVYNYPTGTWAFNEDSITCFGYFQPAAGILWSDNTVLWNDNIVWNSGSNDTLFRQVIAGNQQGWTFVCDPEETENVAALQITDMSLSVISPGLTQVTITCINHNLRAGDYIFINNATGSGSGNNIADINQAVYEVGSDPLGSDTPNSFIISYLGALTGTYTGSGTIARVTPPEILTKQFNFYANTGQNAAIDKVDFHVDNTVSGQICVFPLIATGSTNDTNQENVPTLEMFPYPTYYPWEVGADTLWRTVYYSAGADYIQFLFQMDPAQVLTYIEDPETGTLIAPAFEDFQLHSMIIHASPAGRLQ